MKAVPPTAETWACGAFRFDLGRKPLVMGVINATPDSFSDGGLYLDPRRAVDHALKLAEDGAGLLDVGGESSRPGAQPVDREEELRRILPVVEALAGRGLAVSVDTCKASVAERAVQAGACVINDISAGTADPRMPEVMGSTGAGLVLMHMQGSPRTMQDDPGYRDVLGEVSDYLAGRLDELAGAGVARERMVVDPGIGFGKTLEHNLALLRGLPFLVRHGRRPVLVGLSRKRFLGALTGRDVDDRLAAGLGALAAAFLRGASIFRVHDVKESCDVLHVLATLDTEE